MNGHNSKTGLKIAWVVGFLGVGSWLPILSAILLRDGDATGAWGGFGLYALSLVVLVWLLPWRFPRTPMARLYFANLGVHIVAAAHMVWRFLPLLEPEEGGTGTWGAFLLIPGLLPLLLPAFLLWNRCWLGDVRTLAPPSSGGAK